MARNPSLKKHVAIAHSIANKVRAASSRYAEKWHASNFVKVAGLDHAHDSKRRKKLAAKFPIEFHKKCLECIKPKLYKPRRSSPKPATVTTWEELVELRRRRAAAKQDLWHADDVIDINGSRLRAKWAAPKKERKPKRVLLDSRDLIDCEDER